MEEKELNKLANLDDVSIETLKEYIEEREKRCGASTDLKSLTFHFHTIFCKEHDNPETCECNYCNEDQLEDSWNRPDHLKWLSFTDAVLTNNDILTNTQTNFLMAPLAEIVGIIDRSFNPSSLSKLVKEWIDYTFPQD